jgi:hypothetical protein
MNTVHWNDSRATYIRTQTFFLSFSGWGETESTWYVGCCWPIVPAPDDGRWWLWSSLWNEDWQGKPKYSEKTCLSATLSTTNPTWPDLGSNPGRRGWKPATNRLSYGTANTNVSRISLSPANASSEYIHPSCTAEGWALMPASSRWRTPLVWVSSDYDLPASSTLWLWRAARTSRQFSLLPA